jgi:SAM-dependent methyltransferase
MGDHIYRELADDYAASSASGPPNALYDRPTILRLLGPVQGRRVLELGCAAGHLTAELVHAGADVVALDKSQRMVEHARRLVGDRARVEVADLAEPLVMVDSGSMDLVAASLVLHYLPDWHGVISEVHRVLKPGGALVLSVHHPITGWLRSDRSDYHRVEVIEERWDVNGIETTAQMWRRPVSAIFSPLLHQGLVIDAVHEPEPWFDERAVPDDRMRQALNTSPVFLYVRATRPR